MIYIIFKVTCIIFKMTCIVFKVTYIIFKVTYIVFKVTCIIFKVTYVIFKITSGHLTNSPVCLVTPIRISQGHADPLQPRIASMTALQKGLFPQSTSLSAQRSGGGWSLTRRRDHYVIHHGLLKVRCQDFEKTMPSFIDFLSRGVEAGL